MWNEMKKKMAQKPRHTEKHTYKMKFILLVALDLPHDILPLLIELIFFYLHFYFGFVLCVQVVFYFISKHTNIYICGDAHVSLSTACRFRWHSTKRMRNTRLSAKRRCSTNYTERIRCEKVDRILKTTCSFLFHYGRKKNCLKRFPSF